MKSKLKQRQKGRSLFCGKAMFLPCNAAYIIHIYIIKFGKFDQRVYGNPCIAKFIICISALPDMQQFRQKLRGTPMVTDIMTVMWLLSIL